MSENYGNEGFEESARQHSRGVAQQGKQKASEYVEQKTDRQDLT